MQLHQSRKLKSIFLKATERLIGSLRNAARIATFTARIGIVALKLGEGEILVLLIRVQKEFQARYFAKQQEIEPGAKELRCDSAE